jgi:hypothetical protein
MVPCYNYNVTVFSIRIRTDKSVFIWLPPLMVYDGSSHEQLPGQRKELALLRPALIHVESWKSATNSFRSLHYTTRVTSEQRESLGLIYGWSESFLHCNMMLRKL